ncbi:MULTISPECIES: tetratricopeptide repeat protein [Spirulina sp. CCY15215]|uniref:CHAT domain-containing protein n=1 Tax=Spirulina sp. CCY15215 TaxID=2767591 RepID=UPI0032AF4961
MLPVSGMAQGKPVETHIAQQSPDLDEANRILQEGSQLFQEGSAESLRQAISKLEQAAILFRQAGNQSLEATSLLGVGRIYSSLGEKQKALEYYDRALSLLQAVGDRGGEATTLNNIGLVYNSLGEKQKALEYYDRALPLIRAVGDLRGEARTLKNIGAVYSDLGEKQKALEYLERALSLNQAVGDRGGEANTLNNIGAVYSDLGEKQKALEYYDRALSLLQAVGDSGGEAVTLNNIGRVYSDLGEKQKALEYYDRALSLLQAVGDRRGEATTLNNIGLVYSDLGEKQKALEYYDRALSLLQAVGDRRGEATTLNNIGFVYSDLGEKQKALEYYARALPLIQAVGDRRGEARTLNNIGLVYSDLGEKQKALEYYDRALPLRQAVGDRGGEANTLKNIAFTQRSQGNLKTALTEIEKSIAIIEDLRTKIGSQDLRASYFATVQNHYQFYIDLLMELHRQKPEQGYNARALQASESSHARGLLELLSEAAANIRQGVDPQLLDQEQKLLQQVNNLEKDRYALISSSQFSNTERDDLEQKSQQILEQLDRLEAQIRNKSPRYANLKYPQPLTLQQIQQQVLDDDTLLLKYDLGAEHTYLWLVSKNDISSYELPPETEIVAAAQLFRTALQNPEAKIDTGLTLSQILLSPVADKLQNKRLLIVGEGILQYIPFAALPWGSQAPGANIAPLLANHEIVTLPSASTIAIQRQQFANRTPAPNTLAVLADPIFTRGDERLTGSPQKTNPCLGEGRTLFELFEFERLFTKDEERLTSPPQKTNPCLSEGRRLFDRLQNTRTEAEKILALVPDSQKLQALDFQASRATATNPNLAQYQILHFATHSILDPVNPELSGVVLSLFDETGTFQNGFLRLHDIFNLNLPAELVVLSASKTGLGEDIKGEGLVGLTRGFMYAGAKRVVASLWDISDLATSEMMGEFYRRMLVEKQNPVQALRAAQLAMWNSEQWQSPYYWAAFTIQGDWQ